MSWILSSSSSFCVVASRPQAPGPPIPAPAGRGRGRGRSGAGPGPESAMRRRAARARPRVPGRRRAGSLELATRRPCSWLSCVRRGVRVPACACHGDGARDPPGPGPDSSRRRTPRPGARPRIVRGPGDSDAPPGQLGRPWVDWPGERAGALANRLSARQADSGSMTSVTVPGPGPDSSEGCRGTALTDHSDRPAGPDQQRPRLVTGTGPAGDHGDPQG